MLDGDDALFGQVFDLLGAVFDPVLDVGVCLDAEGAALLRESNFKFKKGEGGNVR